MQFDTKIAIVVRGDLALWQKMNVTAFLSTGIAFETPDLAGEIYRDADGQVYGRLSRQPILIYAATGAALTLDRGSRAPPFRPRLHEGSRPVSAGAVCARYAAILRH